MADSPLEPWTAPRPGTPRWVIGIGIALVAGLVLAVVVMVVSGGQHGPGMHTGGGSASPAPSSSSPGSAAGEPADVVQATRTIEIRTLDSMAFEPAIVAVALGEVVTFIVTNAGSAAHEFTIGDQAMQQEHATAMGHMPEGMRHDLPNSVVVEPGETKELTWRFGQAGALEIACHEPGHYEAGMRAELTVR